MFAETRVRIKKLSHLPDAQVAAGDWKDYVPGRDNGNVSLPVDYEIEGKLITDLVVGQPLEVFRTSRNGVSASGMFNTSPLTVVAPGMFQTQNSTYLIEVLEP